MRGTVTIIHPDEPMEVHILNRAPTLSAVRELVGSHSVEILPYWDQHQTFADNLVPAIVVTSATAAVDNEQFNFFATAAWHYVAKAKGTQLAKHLHGKVIVITGDEDFMDAALSG